MNITHPNHCIKYFTPTVPLGESAPLFPYLLKVTKALSQMNIESHIYTPPTQQTFFTSFHELAKESLKTKQNASPELLSKAQNILISRLAPLQQKTYASLADLGKDLEDVIKKMLNEVAAPARIEVADLHNDLPLKDLHALHIDPDSYYSQLNAGTLCHRCAEYAFYSVKEPRILPWIRGERKDAPFFDLPLDQAIMFLEDWGYQVADEPQAGDLIFYINHSSNLFSHVGVLVAPDRVISKFGTLPVLVHPIEQISNAYESNSYLCFRKAKGDGIQPQMHELFKAVKETIPTFTHPACYSPLSNLGILQVLQQELIHIALKRLHTAADAAPYGKGYFKALIQQRCHRLGPSSLSSLQKRDPSMVIEKVQHIVHQILQELDPMTGPNEI